MRLSSFDHEGGVIATAEAPRTLAAIPDGAATSGSGVVQRVIDLTQQHLGMDVTYVSQFVGDRQTFPAYAGDPASFGVDVADGLPLGVTYCARMVIGDLPNVIPDTRLESRVSDLRSTQRAGIGSYIGVPLRLSDGTLFGSLCCASHHAEPDLGDRDVKFMEVLAELLTTELDREHRLDQTKAIIRNVIDAGQISIALQPVVSLTDGSRWGVEALARFPEGVGSPGELFPAAMTVGLAVELELLAASRAMALAPLLRSGEFLSINVSPGTVRVGAQLTERFPEIAPTRLVFEMTEHQAIDQYDELRRDLRALREQDIRLAIDDAGAGYASLYHIVQLEPDIIKIDRRLVDGSSGDKARRSVIRGFVGLAADIGAVVVGEGVEEPADLEVLRDLGVDAAQGYLLGRPTVDYERIRNGYGTVVPIPLPRGHPS